MKTVVAETVLLGRNAFETLGDVVVIPDRQIGPGNLKDADALVIRSKTKVTPELLAGSAVRFVGTATAGFEHMDFKYLEKSGIGWCAAPGCNADSVADYMTAALLTLHTKYGVELEDKTIGIIGVGQVGSRVAKRAEALGLRVLLNDPPRAAREGDTGFESLEKLLAEADIVTLHVPLIKEQPWPTLKMADDSFFKKMKRGAVFINASRGKVLDSDALLHAKENGIVSHAALDVWDPEPSIRADVLAAATIATPHIAGHSFEGKLNGTVQVYREACRFFKTAPVWDPAPLLPEPAVPELKIDSRGKSDLEVLTEAVKAVYDIGTDCLTEKDIERFDKLRAHYGVRREFKNTTVFLSETRPDLLKKIGKAGFTLA
ncbi:MAG TPA: 4-phosphoerythronate dehydrogenase [Pontiellaceae bacterium]|nr:4-phosphoerythronate dehydrogenase [Pontiellaceae bacterium]HPR83102.1 4-phosphoerythronate dehydrogenase [Pontiellaceae bacterium]